MSQGGTRSREVAEWTKLAGGRYKCSIAASFSSSLNMVDTGICLRNDSGVFVLAKTNCFSPLCDVYVGEVVGLHMALQWMDALHFDIVDFAFDSKRVVFDCIISVCRQLFIDSF